MHVQQSAKLADDFFQCPDVSETEFFIEVETLVAPFGHASDQRMEPAVAGATRNWEIVLWELSTGGESRRLTGHAGPVTAPAFAPDGKTLISSSEDATLLLWDLSGGQGRDEQPIREPDAKQLEMSWNDLAASDAGAVNRAIGVLAAAGDRTIELLQEQLKPAPVRNPAELPKMIGRLSHSDAAERAAAAGEITQFGMKAAPALYDALRAKPPVEVRRRIEAVLEAVGEFPISADDLRRARAIQVLERIGTPAAKQILKTLATGDATTEAAADAKAALDRLEGRQRAPQVKVLRDK